MTYDFGIVIPVYRSRESVKELVRQLERAFLPDITIRICLVDDSDDIGTASYLRENCMRPEVTLVELDGNFGQQAAILCGLRHMGPCRFYGTIDDDMEQPVRILRQLYEQVKAGYDLAYGIPEYGDSVCGGQPPSHGQPPVPRHPQNNTRPIYRRLGSRLRDVMFSYLIGAPGGIRVSSLRAMKAQVVNDALGFGGNAGGFFYLSAAALKGARKNGRRLHIKNLYYTPAARRQGKSGYSLSKLLKLYGCIFWRYGLNMDSLGQKKEAYKIKDMVHGEKLMILGGSNCQLHGAERANAMGVDTVLADYTANPPAASVCRIHERISTFDIEACIKAAKEHQVTGVMTMGTDQPVYTAARICGELGLPGMLTEEQAFSVTNKKRMKEILTQAGIPTAKYRIVDSGTAAEDLKCMKPPLVIKPLDSQGQRGIYKLWSAGEVLGHLESTLSFSRCSEALAEEFYDSDEVTVSGWIGDGTLYILTVTDRLLYPDQTHIGVCTGHRFPSVHMDQYEEIRDISCNVVKAFGLTEGPFYLQLLIGKQGILVNELACRIGGAFEDVFIPWISGFDILGAVLDGALGRKVDVSALKGYRADSQDKCAAVQLLFGGPGKIGSMTPLQELLSLPGVVDAGYNYSPGQMIPVMENATARLGHAVICGTRDNIKDLVDGFYSRISVRSDTGEELIRRFYP